MKKKNYIAIFICAITLMACGNGPTFLYNWRPKPWLHPFNPNVYTGIDTLINLNGYYMIDTTSYEGHTITDSKGDTIVPIHQLFRSVMFYNNGLCMASSIMSTNTADDLRPLLDTLYSDMTFSIKNKNISYKKYSSDWGTYELHADTINVFIIENTPSPFINKRKQVIQENYIIYGRQNIRRIYSSIPKTINRYNDPDEIVTLEFHSLRNKRDSTECPYLGKKWFYKNDRVK